MFVHKLGLPVVFTTDFGLMFVLGSFGEELLLLQELIGAFLMGGELFGILCMQRLEGLPILLTAVQHRHLTTRDRPLMSILSKYDTFFFFCNEASNASTPDARSLFCDLVPSPPDVP